MDGCRLVDVANTVFSTSYELESVTKSIFQHACKCGPLPVYVTCDIPVDSHRLDCKYKKSFLLNEGRGGRTRSRVRHIC